MGYSEARELARIRHELRELLLAGRQDGAAVLLTRLSAMADAPEMRSEYERWRMRFDLLGAAAWRAVTVP